jgi:hypothetical protein
MKKLLPLLLIIAGIGAGWWFYNSQQASVGSSSSPSGSPSNPGDTSVTVSTGSDGSQPNSADSASDASRAALINSAKIAGEGIEEIKTAAETYASADEAFAAALKGAKDFDDSILEQFTEPGPDCSWCPQFYNSVQELVTNPNTPQDQKSYMAELLAISGRPDNVQVLVDSIKNARSSAEADIYAEALELTLGKDDVTKVLGEQLSTTNDTLRESAVAAITNQGTRQAAELLQKHVSERNDPDAYYSQGTGPAEFIPDDEAMPFVQEQVAKRDAYSPQWAKAMVNAGLPGLQSLFDQLDGSSNLEADRALVKGIIDHVNYEDGVKELADNVIANNRNQAAIELARQIKDEIGQLETEESEGATEAP